MIMIVVMNELQAERAARPASSREKKRNQRMSAEARIEAHANSLHANLSEEFQLERKRASATTSLMVVGLVAWIASARASSV